MFQEDGKWYDAFTKNPIRFKIDEGFENNGRVQAEGAKTYMVVDTHIGKKLVYILTKDADGKDVYTPYLLQSRYSIVRLQKELRDGNWKSPLTLVPLTVDGTTNIVRVPASKIEEQIFLNSTTGKPTGWNKHKMNEQRSAAEKAAEAEKNRKNAPIKLESTQEALGTILFENKRLGIRITLSDLLRMPRVRQRKTDEDGKIRNVILRVREQIRQALQLAYENATNNKDIA